MARNFPHLNDTKFPDAGNIDVYKYKNDFDYTRYDYSQMEILVCNVPWDVGEARIGNRAITGIGNVVYFETKEKRDEWFDDIPDDRCFRWQTKLKELHRSNTIDVPLPFDIAAKFNYVVVRYNLFANDGSPVMYEDENGLREWFWFIREVEFLAPNTTRLHLLNDAWQTFIYDLDITGMILERGHAPMFKTKAQAYFENPISKSKDLLAPDIMPDNMYSYPAYQESYIFNAGTMKAVIITTANPQSDKWGTRNTNSWRTPAGHQYFIQGNPALCAFCINASSLNTFITNMESNVPQFAQTIKGICFVRVDMLDLGYQFTFCNVTCNMVGGTYRDIELCKLDKTLFGYPKHYADIAKLYTYPYAYIELTDQNGTVTEIRIETTDGSVKVSACVNMVYPFLKINAHVTNSGAVSRRNVTFKNVDSRSMPIGGTWYEQLMEWDIPVFGIVQDPWERNDYHTHFDRQQQQVAYTNAYDSSIASANTAQTNANASANTAQTNAGNEASNLVNNAALQTSANTTINANNNASLESQLDANIAGKDEMTIANNATVYDLANAQIEADKQSASISSASAMASGALNGVGSAVSGNIAGAVSSILSGAVTAASTQAQCNVAANLTDSQAAITAGNNSDQTEWANTTDTVNTHLTQAQNTANKNATNAVVSGTAANSAATINTNAANTKNTEQANASRTNTTDTANAGRSRNTAINAIDNQIRQAQLAAPEEFGSFGYGYSASTRPLGLFANVVTMNGGGIETVGDEFLRYGYEYGKQWDFNGDWNIGDKFTYWKLRDFWVEGLSIADMYVDKLRFFLFGGVTVWRSPEYIGHTSIYDNGI